MLLLFDLFHMYRDDLEPREKLRPVGALLEYFNKLQSANVYLTTDDLFN